ncbi:MAG: glycosyltransferase family 61 protein [Bacteroidales bacterium]
MEYLYNTPTSIYYSPPVFDLLDLPNSNMIEVKSHTNYAAILKEVIVTGNSNLIHLKNQKALYDIKQYDNNNKFKYSDEAIEFYEKNHCLVKIKNSNISFESAIFLGGNYTWNYYHFVYEVLAKFERINAMKLDINIPFIIDKVIFEIPQFKELLNLLNANRREVILIEKGKRYFVQQLYYFSCPNFIPPNFNNEKDMKAEDVLFDLSSLNYLRKTLLPYATKKDFPNRIFISRSKSANKKRTFNEAEIFDILKSYNFKIVYPENFSFTDQIALFNHADLIVGATGAAFTNLLFCKNSCKVIIFAKNKLPFSGFSTIAKYLNINLIYFTDEISNIDEMKSIHDPSIINATKFKLFLSDWI